jgi:Holliday junction resolvasome RuvABC endonuclease subunit
MAIDPSMTATGVVRFQTFLNDDALLGLKYVRSVTFRPKSTGFYRMADIGEFIGEEINSFKPDILVRELHHMRQFGAAAAIQCINGCIDLMALKVGKDLFESRGYFVLSPSSWKKIVVGKGNLKKDTAYLMTLNQALRKFKRVIDLPESIEDDNIADAICMGIAGFVGHLALRNATEFDHVKIDKAMVKVMENATEYGKAAKDV